MNPVIYPNLLVILVIIIYVLRNNSGFFRLSISVNIIVEKISGLFVQIV